MAPITACEAAEVGVSAIDICHFTELVNKCFDSCDQLRRKDAITTLINGSGLVTIARCRQTGRRVLCESAFLEHLHGLKTASRLTRFNFDVIFAPKGMFRRGEKKFDVFLLRDVFIVRAELKSITSKNPDTIARRIKTGSEQASRLVIDICADLKKQVLTDALRSGVERNDLIVELLVIYRNKCYRLPKNIICSNRIYAILKLKKGYT